MLSEKTTGNPIFAYFVVEAKSKNRDFSVHLNIIKNIQNELLYKKVEHALGNLLCFWVRRIEKSVQNFNSAKI